MDKMKQKTLAAGTGFELHARPTRKAEFLAKMDGLMPWLELCALVEPHYPKAGNGRPPIGLERMLRMYWVANWFNLADEACEDAMYDISVFREFWGLSEILCVRHTMKLERSMYAEQDEQEEACGGIAAHSERDD